MKHILADIWFEKARGEALQRVLQERWEGLRANQGKFWSIYCSEHLGIFQSLLEMGLASDEHDLDGWSGEDLFHDLSNDLVGFAVVTNHFQNDQGTRLFEKKSIVTPVLGAETFPDMAINLELFRENSHLFGKTWKVFNQLFRECFTHTSHMSARKIAVALFRLYKGTSWFLRF